LVLFLFVLGKKSSGGGRSSSFVVALVMCMLAIDYEKCVSVA
jgi:hypothetical protein